MRPFERAARALYALDGVPDNLDQEGKPTWQSYLPKVAAVIAAVHEPSKNMREAGGKFFHAYNPEHSEFANQDDATNVWRSMVDAMREDVQLGGVD